MNKKSTLRTTLVALVMTSMSLFSFGQILLNEGFESGTFPPTGWTTIDLNAEPIDNWSAIGSQYTGYTPFEGDSMAASYSWYNDIPYTPDNWLISPAISIASADTKLTFKGLGSWGTPNMATGDFLTVYVSTTTPEVANFQNVFSKNFTTEDWESEQVDLSAYAGQTIYIAFRHHNCTDQWFLALDDIKVATPYTDIALNSMTYSNYTVQPVTQSPSFTLNGVVSNTGSLDIANYTVTTNIYLDPNYTTPVQTLTVNGTNLAVGTNSNVSLGNYTPALEGAYVFESYVVATGDVDTSNDTLINFRTISNNEFARHDFQATLSTLGIGAGAQGVIGSSIDITNTTNLDSVSFFIAPTVVGGTIQVKIFTFESGTPSLTAIGNGTAINVTQAIVDQATAEGFLTITSVITSTTGGPLSLAPGKYLVGVEESADADNMRLYHSSAIYTAGEFYVSVNGAAFAETASFGAAFARAPILSSYITPATIQSVTITSDDTDNIICNGQSLTLTSSVATGNQWNLNGTPISGATSSTLVVTTAGIFTASVGSVTSNAITTSLISCSNLSENEINGFMVYPNPATDKVTISATDLNDFNTITIKDQLGRNVVHTTKITSNSMVFDISKLANGTYFVELSGDNSSKIAKIQVSK
jgi:hypothetical protein